MVDLGLTALQNVFSINLPVYSLTENVVWFHIKRTFINGLLMILKEVNNYLYIKAGLLFGKRWVSVAFFN